MAAVQDLIRQLQTCRQEKDLAQARRLLAFIRQHHLESHTTLGNHLVPALLDCGSLPDAEHIFGRLPCRNEHSWTSIITAYVDRDNPQHALDLYHSMILECIPPSNYTYLALLRACAVLKDPEKGHEMHAMVIVEGFERDPFIGNTLVDMYGKCGLLPEACHVFDNIHVRDSVSWNALITSYSEGGHGEEALNCFGQMQLSGIPPDDVTFVSTLKGCTRFKDLERGRGIHVQVVAKGLERDTLVGNTLVDMYGKCGLLAEAQQVFDRIHMKIESSWNALTTAYAEHGLGEEALMCFKEMQLTGMCPVPITFACILKACTITGVKETGQEIHADATKRGWEGELYIGTTLVDMYAKCSSLREAHHVFERLPVRDTISWAALISQYAEQGFDEEVLNCFKQIQLEGMSADDVMYACSLKACGSTGALQMGREIHAEIRKSGLERDPYVASMLINMYSKCNSLKEAREVFDRLPVRDVAVWGSIMLGYAENECHEEVVSCFKLMLLDGVPGDSLTFVRSLQACAVIGALDTGREIHQEIWKLGLENDLFVGNMLVDMYGKCGSLKEGQEVFDKMHFRDVVTWNALIKAYAENDEGTMAIDCFKGMQEQGIKPDAITFTCLLAACSHANLISEGQEYFKLMKENHEIAPTLDHFVLMVDLLARSGHGNKAEGFAEVMSCLPCKEISRALLTSSKMYGNVDLGLRCFHNLVQLNQEDATAYLMMADIYASAGRLNDANSIEQMRKYAGQRKLCKCSH